ncbi:MAG: PEGA domain-containing protein [Nitrospinae bacterium]|nr:PEGA domain-containing protein [Nitrospinota bacterium]MBF0634638.1 PEGA domain-containing protein [Nitrospinota bacterium]
MRQKRHSHVLSAIVVALAMAAAPAFAEEAAHPKEIVKKEEAKAKPAVKKTRSAAAKKNAEPKPVEKKAEEKKAAPTTPVTGGGAESPANSSKKGETEVSSVAPAPLPYVTRKVSALVESTPSNCDIEIDGVYVGVTPVELQLKEGVHAMKVSRSGFIAWEKTVKAYNGIFIHATLAQESSRKFEVSETVKAK